MRFPIPSGATRWAAAGCLLAVALLIGPAAPFSGADRPAPVGSHGVAVASSSPTVDLTAWNSAPRVAVRDAPSDSVIPGSAPMSGSPSGSLAITVTLSYSNQSRLVQLLRELAESNQTGRPAYLTGAEFDSEFAHAPKAYRTAVAYFGSFGVTDLTTYPDRATISFDASPAAAGTIFDTRILPFELDGTRYLAPVSAPRLPVPLAAGVVQIVGLSTSPWASGHAANRGTPSDGFHPANPVNLAPSVAGYLAPVARESAQIEYAPDLQVSDDEQTLLSTYGYPLTATVALITSGGNYTGAPRSAPSCSGGLTTGEPLGGWVPGDLTTYFGETLPNGEPSATVTAVPLNGAAAPGCLAGWDTTQAVAANTVDLETIGALAPGARIFGVYGPSPTVPELDTDFATVLNPSAILGTRIVDGLGNVTVVATPWAFEDQNDSSWFSSLQQAAARGITVLAPTGNSADDPLSSAWVNTEAEFPASMSFSAFGDTAVGGTTVTLNPSTLQIETQFPWNVSAKDTTQGGPKGTAGGASEIFLQPSWQKSTSAGLLLGGLGRGIPDLAGVANNTAATVTVGGVQERATNASASGIFYNASGTGVAVAVVAGEIAEMNHALLAAGDRVLGFPNPLIYTLGNLEYSAYPRGSTHGTAANAQYPWSLPLLPFRDVVSGRNYAFRAGSGYDLVTGWGSLDAYNLTEFVLLPSSLPTFGPLKSVQDYVNLTEVAFTPTTAGASVQQNLFLADSLGAPIIWIQTVVNLTDKGGAGWSADFTGWISFPFWGLYPNDTVYEFTKAATGKSETMPLSLDLKTTIAPQSPSWDTTVTFTFGVGIGPVTVTVPGAAYLIGAFDYSYHWQGSTYQDGPFAGTASVPNFLAPQIGLYATPGAHLDDFTSGTTGTIDTYVQPFGAARFEKAQTSLVTVSDLQTYESTENLLYAPTASNNWTIGYSAGAADQGISVGEPFLYPAAFTETGVPATVGWDVVLSPGPELSGTGATSDLSTTLPNGTYRWSVGIASHNFSVAPTNGTILIGGAGSSIPIVFTALPNSVSFEAVGNATFPFAWSVSIASGPTLSGSNPLLETNLTYAKYTYHVRCTNSSWEPKPAKGSFTIGATPAIVQVTFSLVTYKVKITPQYGVGLIVKWHVTVDGKTKKGYATTAFPFPLPNGSYAFNVSGLPSGYSAVPSHGSFVVRGDPAPNIGVRIVPPSGLGGLFGLGIWGYVLVAGVGAAVVLAAILLVRRRRPGGETGAPEEESEATPPPEERPPPPPPAPRQPPRRPGGRREYVDPEEL
ncbi:MAG: protease pro-enzyme activation domain-containing protein [Thermoplasmata archaeon]